MNNSQWQVATLKEAHQISEHMRSLTFTLDVPQVFESGQHYDIRLTAPGGYQAERSYSIANAPSDEGSIELGVELLPDGEVSPYLWKITPGRQIEMRGPIGGHFIWDTSFAGPLIIIGGGSGIVPCLSMLRQHMLALDTDNGRKVLCMTSARSFARIPYWSELQEYAQKDLHTKVVVTLTDSHPEDWKGYTQRIDRAMIAEQLKDFSPEDKSLCRVYICGANLFVDAIAKAMIENGIASQQIKTERYGG